MIQEKTKELDEKIQQLDGSFFGLESGLDPEFKEKWIKALVSGKYDQIHEYLYYEDEEEDSNTGYCCLGVACIITDKYSIVEGDLNSISSFVEIRDLGSKPSDIPEQLRPFVRRSSSTDNKYLCSTGFAEICMTLNDELEFTFKEIAYWLEHYVDAVEKPEDYE